MRIEPNTKVLLDWYELSVAAHVGSLRAVSAVHKGMRRPDGTTSEWSEDVEGAAAEMVVAKALGIYWPAGVDTFHVPDLGRALGVRHTKRPDGRLIVRTRDTLLDETLVLVTGQRGKYVIRGGLHVSDVDDKFRRNPNGWGEAWFVPQEALEAVVTV